MIEAVSFTKKYGKFTAVDNISFTAQKGQVTGILGRNGAGKSTVLSCVCALLYPSSGTVRSGGYCVETHPEEVKRITGFVAEHSSFYSCLTVKEILRSIASLRKIEDKKQAVDRAVSLFSLEEHFNQRADRLSKGFRQRLSFAAAVIHDPPILVLDEPVSGLDPVQSGQLFAFIQKISHDKTILLSTHSMQEAEQLCDVCHIMHNGKIAASGSPREIQQTTKTQSLFDAFLALTAEKII